MTDGPDRDEAELRAMIDELEETLVDLRGELDAPGEAPRIPRGLPGGGRRPPRPPRLREILRFTEDYTIPALISVLETNIQLLRLGGAALRALDPERSAVPGDSDSAVGRALDAGRGLSADGLASGLGELNDALSGTEAPDPEARELLSEAEELSLEIQERLEAVRDPSGERSQSGGDSDVDSTQAAEPVDIDVQDGRDGGASNGSTDDEETPEPDVDAELDSIREEIRGPAADSNQRNGDESTKHDDEDG